MMGAHSNNVEFLWQDSAREEEGHKFGMVIKMQVASKVDASPTFERLTLRVEFHVPILAHMRSYTSTKTRSDSRCLPRSANPKVQSSCSFLFTLKISSELVRVGSLGTCKDILCIWRRYSTVFCGEGHVRHSVLYGL